MTTRAARSNTRDWLMPAVVLVAGILFTVAATWFAAKIADDIAEATFE
jgi:hypothetical protein